MIAPGHGVFSDGVGFVGESTGCQVVSWTLAFHSMKSSQRRSLSPSTVSVPQRAWHTVGLPFFPLPSGCKATRKPRWCASTSGTLWCASTSYVPPRLNFLLRIAGAVAPPTGARRSFWRRGAANPPGQFLGSGTGAPSPTSFHVSYQSFYAWSTQGTLPASLFRHLGPTPATDPSVTRLACPAERYLFLPQGPP